MSDSVLDVGSTREHKTDQGLEPCPHKAFRLPGREKKQILKYYNGKEPQGRENIRQCRLLGRRNVSAE